MIMMEGVRMMDSLSALGNNPVTQGSNRTK